MTWPAVLHGDAQGLVGTILAGLGVPVVSRVPNPRPAAFIRVQRQGGTASQIVADNPMVTVESWAETEEAAHDTLQLVRQAIKGAQGTVVTGVPIYRVIEVAGPASLPDPDSRQERWSYMAQLMTRGAL